MHDVHMATRTILTVEQRLDPGVQLTLFGDQVGAPGPATLVAKVERLHVLAAAAGRLERDRAASRRRCPASRQEPRRVA